MFGQKKAYGKGYKDGHEDGYAVGNRVARYLSTKKEGGRAGQVIFDEIQPGSPLDNLYQALKQEEDS